MAGRRSWTKLTIEENNKVQLKFGEIVISQIPTPALVVDLDAFETNLTRMAERVKASGKSLRPHFKAHKCTEISKRQIALGAIGVCCATVPEAELVASAGITGILLTSPLADPLKMARVIATGAMVVVDNAQQATWYNEAARAAGRKLDVLVDLDVGDHRTGARSKDQALAIAEQVDMAEHLELKGIQAYSVVGSHAGGLEERQGVSKDVFAQVYQLLGTMLRRGLCCDIVTGGSTGTWDIDTQVADLTELQAGSYVLMDMAYRKEGLDFANAMNVLGTVVSANHESFVTTDAGFKAFSTDRGYGPEVLGHPGATYRWGGDEFGYIDGAKLALGDRVRFVPPHCDPTVNLYDRIYACRGEQVEAVWPVKRLAL
jgi:D-serine deaminase-like pyridoxal phosphate-dependent protein